MGVEKSQIQRKGSRHSRENPTEDSPRFSLAKLTELITVVGPICTSKDQGFPNGLLTDQTSLSGLEISFTTQGNLSRGRVISRLTAFLKLPGLSTRARPV